MNSITFENNGLYITVVVVEVTSSDFSLSRPSIGQQRVADTVLFGLSFNVVSRHYCDSNTN